MISVGAAFELGRASQRPVEAGPEFATRDNASVPVVGPLFDEPVVGVETSQDVPTIPSVTHASGPFEVHEVDRPPTSVPTQPPVDTPASLNGERQGSVRMSVLVGTDGGVEAVRMLDEITDSDLNNAAISAMFDWRFNAGSHHGVPVSVWVPARLDFSLAENRMRSVVSVIR